MEPTYCGVLASATGRSKAHCGCRCRTVEVEQLTGAILMATREGMKFWGFSLVFAVAVVAGCGQEPQVAAPQVETLDRVGIATSYNVVPMRSAALTLSDETLTVRRSGDGPVGVRLTRRADADTAALLTFAARGEDVRLRVRQNGEDGYVQRSSQNAVMVGAGGAQELMIYTIAGDRVSVEILAVADCATANVTCEPPVLRTEDEG